MGTVARKLQRTLVCVGACHRPESQRLSMPTGCWESGVTKGPYQRGGGGGLADCFSARTPNCKRALVGLFSSYPRRGKCGRHAARDPTLLLFQEEDKRVLFFLAHCLTGALYVAQDCAGRGGLSPWPIRYKERASAQLAPSVTPTTPCTTARRRPFADLSSARPVPLLRGPERIGRCTCCLLHKFCRGGGWLASPSCPR